jgi:hypothetical protein
MTTKIKNNCKIFKVIIAGTRDFWDYQYLKDKCDKVLSQITDEIWIISGTCTGADMLGERYAKERRYYLMECPAPWEDIEGKPKNQIGKRKNGNLYWKLAGNYRNGLMANEADALIAFHKGNSPGTQDMINKANAKNLKVRVYKV